MTNKQTPLKTSTSLRYATLVGNKHYNSNDATLCSQILELDFTNRFAFYGRPM